MLEQIWNPQTLGQKLMSRFVIPVGCRDNASRNSRAKLSLAICITAFGMLALKRENDQLKARLNNSIEMPKITIPTFKFTSSRISGSNPDNAPRHPLTYGPNEDNS